jgi:hypothetical protein
MVGWKEEAGRKRHEVKGERLEKGRCPFVL